MNIWKLNASIWVNRMNFCTKIEFDQYFKNASFDMVEQIELLEIWSILQNEGFDIGEQIELL